MSVGVNEGLFIFFTLWLVVEHTFFHVVSRSFTGLLVEKKRLLDAFSVPFCVPFRTFSIPIGVVF
jgi:hypothetical protein